MDQQLLRLQLKTEQENWEIKRREAGGLEEGDTEEKKVGKGERTI